jgi:hypothetical protein
MPLASAAQHDALASFITSLADVRWLAHAGDRDDAAIVADDLVDASDNWNPEMMAVWNPETHGLEQVAVADLGEAGIDAVFDAVSSAVDAPLRAAMERYFDTRSTDELNADRGLWPEWLEAMKRDLCWAAVEAVQGQPGFFTGLLPHYRAGRWPCAWEDGDRGKRVVLL